MMPARADEYGDILNSNEIVLQRLRGTCPLDAETLLSLGVTGPLLRAAGHPWDLRKADPYCSYEDFDFKIPVGTVGDNYDRFAVRLAEIYESVKIIEQAIDGLPEGPFITTDRKMALPPRHELATSMEALIHHFKLVTEGFRVPPGEVYLPIESPRGELACYVRSDGSSKPARVHMRDPELRQPAGALAHGQGQLHRRHDRHGRDARSDPRGYRPVSAREEGAPISQIVSPGGSSYGPQPRPGASLRARLARARLGPGRGPREGPGADPRPRAGGRAGRAARGDRGADERLPRPPLGGAARAAGGPGAPRSVSCCSLAGRSRSGHTSVLCRPHVRMGVNSTTEFELEVYDHNMNLVDTVVVSNSDVNGPTPGYDHAIDLTGITGEFIRVTPGPDAGSSYLSFSELEVFAAVPEPSTLVLTGRDSGAGGAGAQPRR